MTTLAALWLPILLSAVFVFLASSVIHMVVQIHKNDYVGIPSEARVLDALRGAVPPGQYRFPYAAAMKDCATPEFQAKLKQGPIGTMVLVAEMNMGKALGQWFVFCVVIGVFVAYVTSLAVPTGAEYMRVFRVAGAVALLGYAFSSVTDSIWKGVSWGVTARFMFDGLVYALLTAGTFAWLWPAAV